MSIEEDTELRDIVLETLDQRGVVGKTKAMLRAHIFTALEETSPPQDKLYVLNQRMKESLSSAEGQLMASLVLDYFDCFDLEFSKTVFLPETGAEQKFQKREDLSKALGLNILLNGEKGINEKKPLLEFLIGKVQKGSGSGDHTGKVSSYNQDLTPSQISEAKKKFSKYDKDNSGFIDKDELRQLFIDMLPGFHPNMLERYVSDEFRAADKDFSAGIDLNEFLQIYKRLFISCRSVVAQDVSEILALTTPRSPSPRQSKIPVKSEFHGVTNGNKKESSSSVQLQTTKIPQIVSSAQKNGSTASKVDGSNDLQNKPVDPVETAANKAKTTEKNQMSVIDKSLADLGFELPDDDFEEDSIRSRTDSYDDDDFERSNASSVDRSSKKSYSDSIKTAESLSTGTTPRLEDGDDDIDALLKDNDRSWDNETTDKSITDDESLRGVDYWEKVPKK